MKQLNLLSGEIIDAAVMSCQALRDFYAREMEAAKEQVKAWPRGKRAVVEERD